MELKSSTHCSSDPNVPRWYRRSGPPSILTGDAIHNRPPPPINTHTVSRRRFPPTCLYPLQSIRGLPHYSLRRTFPSSCFLRPPTVLRASMELLPSGLLTALVVRRLYIVFPVTPQILFFLILCLFSHFNPVSFHLTPNSLSFCSSDSSFRRPFYLHIGGFRGKLRPYMLPVCAHLCALTFAFPWLTNDFTKPHN